MTGDFKDKELITIQLPREDYEVLETIITERKLQSYLRAKITSWVGFVVIGGILSFISLFDYIKGLIDVK